MLEEIQNPNKGVFCYFAQKFSFMLYIKSIAFATILRYNRNIRCNMRKSVPKSSSFHHFRFFAYCHKP